MDASSPAKSPGACWGGHSGSGVRVSAQNVTGVGAQSGTGVGAQSWTRVGAQSVTGVRAQSGSRVRAQSRPGSVLIV